MLEDNVFITWLANGTGYKPNRLKEILKGNKPNKRTSKFTAANFQEIYDFWLDNCINSNESSYNMKESPSIPLSNDFPASLIPTSLRKGWS